jgi:hypothetical protein
MLLVHVVRFWNDLPRDQIKDHNVAGIRQFVGTVDHRNTQSTEVFGNELG